MRFIAAGANVKPIAEALEAHPELWNEYTMRTESSTSPHREVSDIWARYAKPEEMMTPDEHESVWYPSADILGIKPIVFDLMHMVRGARLGGVLITKIPAGKQCYPHRDNGWHARHYDKYAVQIKGDFKQAFQFEGESFSALPGEIYSFDNAHTHWVTNDSEVDRITMIVCIRS